MRTYLIAAALAGVASILAPAQSFAGATSSPIAFVNELYNHYRNGRAMAYSPWGEPEQSRIFEPGLVKLMKEEVKLLNGEEGSWMDADTFCECQDTVVMNAPVALISATPTAAVVSVDIAPAGQAPHLLRIKLITVGSGWRIADVISTQGDSLRAAVIKDLADMRKSGANK